MTSALRGRELLLDSTAPLSEENAMATQETLEQRLAALEREVAQLKSRLTRDASAQDATEESLGARLMRESKEGHADFVAGWRAFIEALGIKREPVGAKKLREMLLKAGINPEDNEFSRGTIAMRGE
jgi:uncharacterized small protein (DUF1192 family)